MTRQGRSMIRRCIACFSFAAFICISAWPASPRGPKVAYTVDVQRTATHLITVGIKVDYFTKKEMILSMPAWLPGYNRIQDFARNVQEFAAEDGSGRSLRWDKTDKQTWRIDTAGASSVRVSYKVFANNLLNINVAAHADETHAFFNGAAIFCYLPEYIDRAVTLRVLKPADWEIATGLEAGDEDDQFRARSYDELVDCPTEIGPFVSYEFIAAGKRHRIAIYGLRDHDASYIVPDIARIVETCARIFGILPYKSYTFIYHLVDRDRRSGVEHANSTAMIINKRNFHARRDYDDFLDLTAHEYFHLWNIKRIHPRGWGPFNYSREAYTKSHWFTEGLTSYYAGLILVRAGLWTPERFYSQMAAHFTAHETCGGRDMMSLEEASWNNWLKPDNAADTTISYYEKGAVVGWMLDMEIRRRTGGLRSLDDVMRELDRTFGARGVAYVNEDLLHTIQEVAGSDFSAFYERWVESRGPLLLDEHLSPMGLVLARIEDPPAAGLGIDVERAPGDAVRVARTVPSGSGAEGGLEPGDLLLALNGTRVRFEDWQALLDRQVAGRGVRLDLYRGDDLISKTIAVEAIRKVRFLIREDPSAGAEAVARRKALFSCPPREDATGISQKIGG